MARGLFDGIGERYRAGTLLGGRGALGGMVSPEARQEAQRRAIMQLGSGLLGQGPTRTPQRFGQTLAQGLLGAQQQFDKGLLSELQQELTGAKVEEARLKTEGLKTLRDPESTSEEKLDALGKIDPAAALKLELEPRTVKELQATALEALDLVGGDATKLPFSLQRALKVLEKTPFFPGMNFGFGGISTYNPETDSIEK